ncbi:MAG: CoA transferase [Rickettsiales bacterium]|jgi:crotonobetainyl-CoA:carnitine CoA-transferase CaiB-like acyl-CoA transferase
MAANGKGALAGVRILDLTQFEAGPSCTEALAWLGAEVVKLENPKGGDQGRLAASEDGKTDAYYFLVFNANKKSVTCDLKSEAGLALVKKLVREADVMIENFAPGVIERLGLGYDDVKAINPSIIYAQVKGFAEGGPYEKFLSFDMIGQASGGIMSITGEPDGRPLKPGTTLGDTGTGMLMAISILGALYQKKETGEGQRLTLAMQDAMLQYARLAFSDTMKTGKPSARAGEGVVTGGNAPMGLFPCKPGGSNDYVYIYVNRGNNRQWHRLLEVIGRADLIGDARYETAPDRFAHKAEINALLEPWTLERTKTEAMDIIGGAGVPCGAIYDTLELSENPDFEERGIFQWIDHPTRGKVKMPAWPVKMSGNDIKVEPAPLLGEHNEEILSDWLGMSPDEIAQLKAEGAV